MQNEIIEAVKNQWQRVVYVFYHLRDADVIEKVCQERGYDFDEHIDTLHKLSIIWAAHTGNVPDDDTLAAIQTCLCAYAAHKGIIDTADEIGVDQKQFEAAVNYILQNIKNQQKPTKTM